MKQAILIFAHKDSAASKKLIAYFKQDCYVFVEVYVGSANNIPEGPVGGIIHCTLSLQHLTQS